jgi:octaprenyl-diphosphate synthase
MGVVIPLDGAGNKKRASIEPLVKLTASDMERVNESILSHARSHVELIPEIASHLINSGGKRIRPMLTLAAARMCGYGRAPPEARHRRRVHAHGHPAA